MTLTDIIIRDLAYCRREEEAEAARVAAEKACRDYDRAITRRLWRRRFRAIGDVVGGILLMLLAIALFWLFLIATPDQMSAECDWARAEMESMGK